MHAFTFNSMYWKEPHDTVKSWNNLVYACWSESCIFTSQMLHDSLLNEIVQFIKYIFVFEGGGDL